MFDHITKIVNDTLDNTELKVLQKIRQDIEELKKDTESEPSALLFHCKIAILDKVFKILDKYTEGNKRVGK